MHLFLSITLSMPSFILVFYINTRFKGGKVLRCESSSQMKKLTRVNERKKSNKNTDTKEEMIKKNKLSSLSLLFCGKTYHRSTGFARHLIHAARGLAWATRRSVTWASFSQHRTCPNSTQKGRRECLLRLFLFSSPKAFNTSNLVKRVNDSTLQAKSQ